MNFSTRCMKKARWLVIPLSIAEFLVACGGSPPTSDTNTKTATLTGEQEVPAVSTAAVGSGSLTLDRATGALSGSITLDGVTATAAHIHQGAVGANGSVVVNLTQSSTNTWSVPSGTVLTASQIASFDAGTLYFNAHSTTYANGEIRGQIGREVYFGALSGKQEVPPTSSTATGKGSVVLDPVTKTLTGSVTVTGMVATIAHIHTGAVGSNGTVAVGLSETSAGSGAWVVPSNTILTDAQIDSLRAGQLYFNTHSVSFQNGEIRGQLNRKVGYATLNGSQEVPPVTTTAAGTGFLFVDPATRGVTGSIAVTGVTPTAAHVHQAAAGVNGTVQITLTQSAPGSSTWVVPANTMLTAAQYDAFVHGNLYFNVHSTAFTGGEIRGQIDGDGHVH